MTAVAERLPAAPRVHAEAARPPPTGQDIRVGRARHQRRRSADETGAENGSRREALKAGKAEHTGAGRN